MYIIYYILYIMHFIYYILYIIYHILYIIYYIHVFSADNEYKCILEYWNRREAPHKNVWIQLRLANIQCGFIHGFCTYYWNMFELTSIPRNLCTILSLEFQWISVVLRGRISRITSGRCCSGRRTWVGGERMDSLLKCKESGGKKMRHESWDDAFTDRLCLGYKRQRQKGLGKPRNVGQFDSWSFQTGLRGIFTTATATSLEQGH